MFFSFFFFIPVHSCPLKDKCIGQEKTTDILIRLHSTQSGPKGISPDYKYNLFASSHRGHKIVDLQPN